jgi:tRNA threonylcarbamoyladenosine biosynthesis protein TsaE
LPKPDLIITIRPRDEGRTLTLSPKSSRGETWCAALAPEFK